MSKYKGALKRKELAIIETGKGMMNLLAFQQIEEDLLFIHLVCIPSLVIPNALAVMGVA